MSDTPFRALFQLHEEALATNAPDFVFDALLDIEGWLRTRDEQEQDNVQG